MDHWVIDGFNEVKTVYEYFVEKFGNKFYTMEQMEVLAYIERYADKKSPYYYIDQIQRNMDQDEQDKLFGPKKKVEQTFYHKSRAKQSAYYRGIQELDIPGQEFGNFKNDFKKRINHVLKEITGGNFSLATCRKSFHEEHNNTFLIQQFANRLYLWQNQSSLWSLNILRHHKHYYIIFCH